MRPPASFMLAFLGLALSGYIKDWVGPADLKALFSGDRGLQDLEAFVARDYGPPEPIKLLPPLPAQPVLIYDITEYNDLFSEDNLDLVAEAETGPVEGDAEGPDRTRPREPLEAFPLDRLDWVGLVETRDAHWALIRDPGGRVHRVTLGHYIGQDFGRIEAINRVSINIVEIRRLPDGNWIHHGNRLSKR